MIMIMILIFSVIVGNPVTSRLFFKPAMFVCLFAHGYFLSKQLEFTLWIDTCVSVIMSSFRSDDSGTILVPFLFETVYSSELHRRQ